VSGIEWAKRGDAPPDPPGGGAAREVGRTAEATAAPAAEALAPLPRARVVTQDRLRLYAESKEYAERERREIALDIDAGAAVEAGVIQAAVTDSEPERAVNFRAELVKLADALIQRGAITGHPDGEGWVRALVKGAPYRPPTRRLKVWR